MDLNYARHAPLADDPEQIIRLEAGFVWAQDRQVQAENQGQDARQLSSREGIRGSIARVRGRFRPGMMSRLMSPFSAPKDFSLVIDSCG
jgi:hypothetical protein